MGKCQIGVGCRGYIAENATIVGTVSMEEPMQFMVQCSFKMVMFIYYKR